MRASAIRRRRAPSRWPWRTPPSARRTGGRVRLSRAQFRCAAGRRAIGGAARHRPGRGVAAPAGTGVRLRGDRRRRQHAAAALHPGARLLPVSRQDVAPTRCRRGKAGIALGAPKWPQGTAHRDEHFGDVVVFFDQVDVPLPLRRTRTEATELTLTANFQGCQTDGICYPPMTRTVQLDLPAGKLTAASDAVAPAVPPATPTTGEVPSSATERATTATGSMDPASNAAATARDASRAQPRPKKPKTAAWPKHSPARTVSGRC